MRYRYGLCVLLLTATLSASFGAWALAERGHQTDWGQAELLSDLPKDWRKRLVVGKPMERPLLERAELVYKDAEQRVITLRLAELLVHVRKQDNYVIAVTNTL